MDCGSPRRNNELRVLPPSQRGVHLRGAQGVDCHIPFTAQGIPTVGVIYDPYRNEMFTAIKGHGAFMNNEPIHVRSDPTLHESLLGYATNYVEPVRKAMMRGVGAVGEYALKSVFSPVFTRSIRNIGAAALNLAWVAAGRLTGYWELGLHPVGAAETAEA